MMTYIYELIDSMATNCCTLHQNVSLDSHQTL